MFPSISFFLLSPFLTCVIFPLFFPPDTHRQRDEVLRKSMTRSYISDERFISFRRYPRESSRSVKNISLKCTHLFLYNYITSRMRVQSITCIIVTNYAPFSSVIISWFYFCIIYVISLGFIFTLTKCHKQFAPTFE